MTEMAAQRTYTTSPSRHTEGRRVFVDSQRNRVGRKKMLKNLSHFFCSKTWLWKTKCPHWKLEHFLGVHMDIRMNELVTTTKAQERFRNTPSTIQGTGVFSSPVIADRLAYNSLMTLVKAKVFSWQFCNFMEKYKTDTYASSQFTDGLLSKRSAKSLASPRSKQTSVVELQSPQLLTCEMQGSFH